MLRGIPRDAWMRVKYEELCADVVGVCKDLCEFLGYDCDPVMFDFSAREQHTIGGNKIRYTPINEIREDLSWQTNLSTEDICQIERISDRMAKEIGY